MINNKMTDPNNTMYVSNDIYNEDGVLLIVKGTIITEKLIRFCERRNISLKTCYENPLLIREKKIVSSKKLLKDCIIKFNFIDQQYSKYAPKLVSDVIEDINNKKIASFDLSIMYRKMYWVYAHSINVSLLSAIFAYKLKMNVNNTRKLVLAALLHDIGKTIIPSTIINKKGELYNAPHCQDTKKIL